MLTADRGATRPLAYDLIAGDSPADTNNLRGYFVRDSGIGRQNTEISCERRDNDDARTACDRFVRAPSKKTAARQLHLVVIR
jgi:hypothetical protein